MDSSNFAESDKGDRSYAHQLETIDFRELLQRMRKGAYQIFGLALLGLAISGAAVAFLGQVLKTDTTTRVVFSFPGFERGEYPDGSKFQADDLRAPAIIAEAMRRLGMDNSEDAQSKIRGAISIEGIIPETVMKTNDRLRATGQTPPPYLPDEYTVTLTLGRDFPLSSSQRERLLVEIVNVARENFQRTYGQLPIAFGTAFSTLRDADYPEYEIVFNAEIASLISYLQNEVDFAKSFRSPSTNLSFKDLLEQVNLFARLDLNETLGLISQYGLARDRAAAVRRMNYYLEQLGYDEQHAIEDDKVVEELLSKAEARGQNYVLGVKSQVLSRPGEAPILDQGLVDSLVANDAYNFLVRKALDAGLKVKELQEQRIRLTAIRDNLIAFEKKTPEGQAAALGEVHKSLAQLEATYNRLVESVRKTQADYALQQYGRAVQLSASIHSFSVLKSVALGAVVGAVLGAALGVGLSILDIFIAPRRRIGERHG